MWKLHEEADQSQVAALRPQDHKTTTLKIRGANEKPKSEIETPLHLPNYLSTELRHLHIYNQPKKTSVICVHEAVETRFSVLFERKKKKKKEAN